MISLQPLFIAYAIILALLILSTGWATIYNQYRQAIATTNISNQKYWESTSSLTSWLKKHLLYSPLWTYRHSNEYHFKGFNFGPIPGRFYLIILASWVLLHTVLVIPIHVEDEILESISKRAGILAMSNLLSTILFSLRNNPLILLINVHFHDLNRLHRWSARLFSFQVLLHSFGYLGYTTQDKQRWSDLENSSVKKKGYALGAVATLASIIILIQACHPVRHLSYEIFLVLHRLLAFIVVLGSGLHLRFNQSHQSLRLMIISVTLMWTYEIISRIIRIVWYNTNRHTYRLGSDVTIKALRGACRVTFYLPVSFPSRPGMYIHAWIPRVARFQSHPFSVAWSEYTENGTSISIIAQARHGFTAAVLEQAEATRTKILITWGVCEGFYGVNRDLSSYGTVVLFAGGVGITHQLLFMKFLLEGNRDGTVAAEHVRLVWCFPTSEYLEWVLPWLEKLAIIGFREDCVRIDFYITRQPDWTSMLFPSFVTVQRGRCDAGVIMKNTIDKKHGAVAVTVCGPGSLADHVRAAVRSQVDRCMVAFWETGYTY